MLVTFVQKDLSKISELFKEGILTEGEFIQQEQRKEYTSIYVENKTMKGGDKVSGKVTNYLDPKELKFLNMNWNKVYLKLTMKLTN
ncbi:hypothetical protein QTG56_16075 [Rossellomorea sp. AcN35-11]|nr:hypothetical protein [Rossellomorea aquimaris]WJV28577.1 hypothetical protein QTG56_16075 [Rossellomorea sp. AcN35-11]